MSKKVMMVALSTTIVALGGATTATASVTLATQVQQIMAEPHSQLTDAQRATAALALQAGTVTVTSTPNVTSNPTVGAVASVRRARAASNLVVRCFGPAGVTVYRHIVGGANVAWVESYVGSWCTGPGGQYIYSVNGWAFPNWSNWPYCLTQDQDYHGGEGSWDGAGHSNWVHAIQHAQVGVSYPWGCGGGVTLDAALRFANTGYVDGYNDWGF